uniref:Uncharacterized protein n=1 Tax=Rhizophora mucronata TaxID=61149 RepID=A0A2P2P6P0_RHIMU
MPCDYMVFIHYQCTIIFTVYPKLL